MKNPWVRSSLAAIVVATCASVALACDQHADAAEAKDAKAAAGGTAVVAKEATKGCDMPCCAHAKAAADDKLAANAVAEKPCGGSDAKGCPKKASTKAAASAKADPSKVEPAKETAKAEPAPSSGTQN